MNMFNIPIRFTIRLSMLLTLAVFVPTTVRAADFKFGCYPKAVMDWGPTVVVNCKNYIWLNGYQVHQVAIDTTTASAESVDRFVSRAQTAILAGNQTVLCWIPEVGTSFYQCSTNECRGVSTRGFGL